MSKSSGAQKLEVTTGDFSFDPVVVMSKFEKWFPALPHETREKLVAYQSELIRFSKLTSLVSTATLRNAEAVHIADAVLASQVIHKGLVPNEPVYDVGIGNGFPGLTLALLYPGLKCVISARDPKKAEFCRSVIGTLKLSNAFVELKGVEEFAAGSMVNVVARGLGPIQKSLLLCRKHVRKGGKFFHLKSDGWVNEVAQIPSQLFSFWSPSLLGQYRIPDSSVDMAVVLTDKLAE